MRIGVTGGAGFIGANLTRRLVEAGHDVVVVDDLSTGDIANLAGVDADVRKHSILETELLRESLDGCEAVVHLAALPSVPRSLRDPVATNRVNVDGTVAVLEAAREVDAGHVVVASSSSVYGANPTLPKSEDLRTQPLSPYAVSKLATEQYALAYQSCFDLPVLAFRFFNVFGPLQPAGHDYAAVIPAFVSAALEGRPLPLHGDGGQTRDFTYVGSVCRVIEAAVTGGVCSPDPVNLAFGTRRSLVEAIASIEAILDAPVSVAPLPPRPGDVRHSQADQSRLRGLFPDVEPIPFEEGLRRTIAWFQEEVMTSRTS